MASVTERPVCVPSVYSLPDPTAPVSHQKQPDQNATNAIDIKQNCSKINKADQSSAAHNGLVEGSCI